MRVALDAMGGDYAPDEIVRGALLAHRVSGADVILVGDQSKIRACLTEVRSDHIPEVYHASEHIQMHEAPAQAVRRKKDSSIAVCCDLILSGEANAMVSAGNTGAVMATAMLKLRPIPGIDRPAIGTVLPTRKARVFLLDVGACVDCDVQNLVQFALMGSVYAERVLGLASPRVGLMSIGEEESKGNELTKGTFKALSSAALNFRGNVEGRDLFSGEFDVVVCDGFIGNVVLKTTEGAAEFIVSEFKNAIESSWFSKIPMLLAKRPLRGLRRKLDYAEYGGAPLLGINGVCIISHGRSHAKAVAAAINIALQTVREDVVGQIMSSLPSYRPLIKEAQPA